VRQQARASGAECGRYRQCENEYLVHVCLWQQGKAGRRDGG